MLFNHETLMPGWYLLKVKTREELRAVSNLENQEFEVYCPLLIEQGRDVPLFPGYLFVRLNQDDLDRYHKIRSTRGVSEVVHFNRINQKLFQEGRLSSRDKTQLLPRPIPCGDQLIDQIEAYLWQKNGSNPQTRPDSAIFQAGDKVSYDNPLFRHLDSTFVKGVNMDRGVILIRFIESLRTEVGVQNQVTAERTVEVPLSHLRKKV
ncbi:MAG: transcription termination/antitermination NusG family protein [Endozoicomonas sp.]